MSKYLDRYHSDADKRERKQIAHELAEYATDADIGDNYKLADKARKLQAEGKLDKDQILHRMALADKYKKDKPSGKFNKDEIEHIRQDVEEQVYNELLKKEKKKGTPSDSINTKKLHEDAEQYSKEYMEDFKKLL